MSGWIIPLASIIVSAIAAWSARASSKASARASTVNATVAREASGEQSRVEMEKDAYTRARKLDVETIERLEAEVSDLRTSNEHLNNDVKMVHRENAEVRETNARILAQNRSVLEDNRTLRREVARLRQRLTRFERGLDPNDETPVPERSTDTNPYILEAYDGE